MILLCTDRNGVREVIANVDVVQTVGLSGSRTTVKIIRRTGIDAGTIELHDARVELLPDDPDA